MSYYTNYNIRLTRVVKDDFKNAANAIVPASLTAEIESVLPTTIEQNHNGTFGGMATWYQHERDLSKVSERYPDWLITIVGDGECEGDLWVTYIYDGLCQTHQIKDVADLPDVNPTCWTNHTPTPDELDGAYGYHDKGMNAYDRLEMMATVMNAITDDYYKVQNVKIPNEPNGYRTVIIKNNGTTPVLNALQHYQLFAAKRNIMAVIRQILKEIDIC